MNSSMLSRLRQEWAQFHYQYFAQRVPFFTPQQPHYQYESVSFGFILGLIFLFGAFFSPMPADDLLRHVHAWRYDYDYRLLFPDYPYAFNSWHLFDVAVGGLYQLFGDLSIKLIQGMSLMLFAVGVWLNLKGLHPDWKKLVVLLVIWLLAPRFLLARPAMFEASLMLIAIGLTHYRYHPWVDRVVHLSLGMLMVSFYHLFFIYTLPLLLWRKIYIVPMLVGAGSWYFLTDGDYAVEVYEILTFGSLRIEGVIVSENVFALPVIALVLATAWLFAQPMRQQWRWWLMAGWFSLPMQLRYLIDILYPVAAILLAKRFDVRPHPFLLLLALVAVKSSTGTGFYFAQSKSEQPLALFEQGERVLAESLGTNFWVVNQGAAQGIQVFPAMEIGFSPADIQQIGLDAKVSCELLYQYQIDVLVESRMIELPMACLRLRASTVDGYKLWQVEN